MNKELREAIDKNDIEKIKKMVKDGVDLKARSNSGYTPLLLAALNGHVELAAYFLKLPDVDIQEQSKSETGHNVLSASAQYGYVRAVAFFLKKGAYIDMRLNNGQTPREYIEERGANLTTLSLLRAAEDLIKRASGQFAWGRLDDLLIILEKNLNARLIDSGNSALHLAVTHKQTHIVKLLLENDADVLIPNNLKETPHRLLQVIYNDNPYFLALSHLLTLNLAEVDIAENKRQEERVAELKKIRESRQFDGKELKGMKEKNERSKTVVVKLGEGLQKELLEKYEKTLNTVEELLNKKMSEEELETVCLKMGKILFNPNNYLYDPARAYRILSRVSDPLAEPKFKQSQETHKLMLDILLSTHVFFDFNDLDDEATPANTAIELDGQKSVETEKSQDFRLKRMIRHILYSETEHRDALGGIVAQYALGAEHSINGIKGFKGNDNESICSLVDFLKGQMGAYKECGLENKKLREENEKMRQELIKFKSMENKETKASKETKETKEAKEKREQQQVKKPEVINKQQVIVTPAKPKPAPAVVVVANQAKPSEKPLAFSNGAAAAASAAKPVASAGNAAASLPVPASKPSSKIALLKQQLGMDK